MTKDQKTFAAVVVVLLGGNADSILDREEKHMDCDRINALELELFKLQLEVKHDHKGIELAEQAIHSRNGT